MSRQPGLANGAIIGRMTIPKKHTKKKTSAKKPTTKKPPAWKPTDELAALIAEWEAKLVGEGHEHAIMMDADGKVTRGVSYIPAEPYPVLAYDRDYDGAYGVYVLMGPGSSKRLRDASLEARIDAVKNLLAFTDRVRSTSREQKERVDRACKAMRAVLDLDNNVPSMLGSEL